MKLVSKFMGSQRGNVGVVFAAVTIPLTLAVGLAIDYSNSIRLKNELNYALDAAALAAAKAPDAERQSVAEDMFTSSFNFDRIAAPATVSVSVSGQTLTATATATYMPYFMVGENVEVSRQSKVRLMSTYKTEVVFVLDYSSSMNSKYVPMRDAAVDLITTLTDNLTSTDIKIGLVPFARQVYMTIDGKYVLGGTNGIDWSNCTIGRKWPWVWMDHEPTSDQDSKWGRTDSDNVIDADEYDDCPNYPANNLQIRDLTTDHAGTVAKLQAMTPYSGTNVALGMEMAHHLISNKPPFTQAVDFGAEGWRKYVVLLTDGRHNKKGFGPGTIFSDAQGIKNLDLICDELKKDNVEIITIAYDLDDPEGKDDLEKCASNSQYVLEGDENTIADLFGDVGRYVSTVYLTE